MYITANYEKMYAGKCLLRNRQEDISKQTLNLKGRRHIMTAATVKAIYSSLQIIGARDLEKRSKLRAQMYLKNVNIDCIMRWAVK